MRAIRQRDIRTRLESPKGQTDRMDRSTALDSLDLESSRFLVAVSNGAATLDAAVPTCPGWDVAQLVNHLGVIYSRTALVISDRRTRAPDSGELPSAPEGDALLGWFAEQRTAALGALEAADNDTLVWNWTGDSPGPADFWSRRLAHETLIHRVDIELAQDLEPAHGYPEVAADTVTEFFELFYPRFESQMPCGPSPVTPCTFTPLTYPARNGPWTLETSRPPLPISTRRPPWPSGAPHSNWHAGSGSAAE